MTAAAQVADLQRLAHAAAADEAEALAASRQVAAAANALVAAYQARGVPTARALQLTIALLPIVIAAGDRP